MALALLAACRAGEVRDPPVLRVAAPPQQDPPDAGRRHGALVEEVCRRAALRCEWVEVASREELVDGIGRGAVDLAYLGGVAFARARHTYGVIPVAMRDVDAAVTSVVIVRSDSSARSLRDLRGKVLAFGSERSTSGNVMPRYFLAREGLEPASAFPTVVLSERHDATIAMVADGAVDAGAVNASVLLAHVATGDPAAARVRVLWRSPAFAGHVWAARRELPAAVRQRLLDGFLDLDRSVPAQRDVLLRENAGGFLPARADDWRLVTAVLAEEGEL